MDILPTRDTDIYAKDSRLLNNIATCAEVWLIQFKVSGFLNLLYLVCILYLPTFYSPPDVECPYNIITSQYTYLLLQGIIYLLRSPIVFLTK